jgi:hypothetical protein
LDRWNPAYFARLRRFCREAERRGVVVELVMFSRMYTDERWRTSPLHPDNNRQGEAWRGMPFTGFIRGESRALLDRQRAMVRKIVTELRDVPNVYFEIANEPAARLIDSEDGRAIHAWHEAIAEEIASAEAQLPAGKRHLIAWNSDYGQGIGPTPRHVSVINFHYLQRLATALDEYSQDKPLGYDETRWIAHDRYPQYSNTMTPEAGRIEAWEFLLGGGAVYSNLNHAYQVEDPEGRRPESERFKRYLAVLKRFMESNAFQRMRQDRNVVTAGVPAGSTWRAITEPGKQYALYLHHSSSGERRRSYAPSERSLAVELALSLPPGSYHIEWVAPASGAVLRTDSLKAPAEGSVKLRPSPEHSADIALRIVSAR